MINAIQKSLYARACEGLSPAEFAQFVERAHTVRSNDAGNPVSRNGESVAWLFALLGVLPWSEELPDGEPASAFVTEDESREVGLAPDLVLAFVRGADHQWTNPERRDAVAPGSPKYAWYRAGRTWAAVPAEQALPAAAPTSTPAQRLTVVRSALVHWIDEAPDEALAKLNPSPESVLRSLREAA